MHPWDQRGDNYALLNRVTENSGSSGEGQFGPTELTEALQVGHKAPPTPTHPPTHPPAAIYGHTTLDSPPLLPCMDTQPSILLLKVLDYLPRDIQAEIQRQEEAQAYDAKLIAAANPEQYPEEEENPGGQGEDRPYLL